MVNQASSQERSADLGRESPVPIRETGTGKNTNHPWRVTDDELTDKRRAKYGEDENHTIQAHVVSVETNVNQVPTKRNQTKNDQIWTESFGFLNHFMSG